MHGDGVESEFLLRDISGEYLLRASFEAVTGSFTWPVGFVGAWLLGFIGGECLRGVGWRLVYVACEVESEWLLGFSKCECLRGVG